MFSCNCQRFLKIQKTVTVSITKYHNCKAYCCFYSCNFAQMFIVFQTFVNRQTHNMISLITVTLHLLFITRLNIIFIYLLLYTTTQQALTILDSIALSWVASVYYQLQGMKGDVVGFYLILYQSIDYETLGIGCSTGKHTCKYTNTHMPFQYY